MGSMVRGRGKRSVTELGSPSRQLTAMFEATREGMAVLDAAGMVLNCNRAYAEMVGRPRGEVLGANCCDLSLRGVRFLGPEWLSRLAGVRRREEFEVSAGGSWFRVTLDPIISADGRLMGVAQVIRDITPRKDAEEALRLSEEKFSKAFEASPDWMVISTLAEGRYIEVNPAFLKATGYTRDEVMGRSALDLGIWADPSERVRMLRTMEIEGSVADMEARFRMKSGELRTVLWSAKPIQYKGERCLIALARDITERKAREEELREANQALRAIIAAAPLAIFSLDAEGRVKSWNPAAERMFGWRQDEVLGMPLPIVPEESQEQFRSLRERVLSGETILNVELRRRKKDGSPIYIRLSGAPLRDEKGRIDSIMAIIDDISERRVMEQKLLQAKQEWERTFESVRDLIAVMGTDHRIRRINKAMALRLSADPEAVIGRPCYEVVHGTKEPPPHCPHRGLDADGKTHSEELYEARLGGYFSITVTPLHDEQGCRVGSVHVAHDITERKRTEEAMRELAYHDPLTGLPNRRLLNDRYAIALANAARNGKRMAVMMLDLDRFKEINDALGHHVGDELLKGVAERLVRNVRKGDSVSRLGGDEFVILLSQISEEAEAGRIAERVVSSFHSPFRLGGLELKVTPSIGVAIFPEDGGELDVLLERADQAMYRVKEKGRDNWGRYSPSMEGPEREEAANPGTRPLRGRGPIGRGGDARGITDTKGRP